MQTRVTTQSILVQLDRQIWKRMESERWIWVKHQENEKCHRQEVPAQQLGDSGAGTMSWQCVFGGRCLRWDSYLHPSLSAGWWDGGQARLPLPVLSAGCDGCSVGLIQPPPSVATLATNAISQQMLVGIFFGLELNWNEGRRRSPWAQRLEGERERERQRERGRVCHRFKRAVPSSRRVKGVFSWRSSGGRRDVWSGRSAALAAPPRPPPSHSRTRGRPRWAWTLSPRGVHISHLKRGTEERERITLGR